MKAIAQPPAQVQTFSWQWQSQPVEVAYETLGEGVPTLFPQVDV